MAPNLIGRVVGRLTVVAKLRGSDGRLTYLCRCDCGNERDLPSSALSGNTTSCGCLKLERLRERNRDGLRDLEGSTWGSLTIGARSTDHRSGKPRWSWQCECGTKGSSQAKDLVARYQAGRLMSCGCLVGESRRKFQRSTLQQQYQGHQADGRKRGHGFLERSLWESIVFQACAYCGGSDVRRSGHVRSRNYASGELYEIRMNGIDRVDSKRGYEPDNVVPCCRACNVAKSSMSKREFIEWVRRVAVHLGIAEDRPRAG